MQTRLADSMAGSDRWFWEIGGKRQTVEIQVTNVGPDLQFATAEVARSALDGFPSVLGRGKSFDLSRYVLRLWVAEQFVSSEDLVSPNPGCIRCCCPDHLYRK